MYPNPNSAVILTHIIILSNGSSLAPMLPLSPFSHWIYFHHWHHCRHCHHCRHWRYCHHWYHYMTNVSLLSPMDRHWCHWRQCCHCRHWSPLVPSTSIGCFNLYIATKWCQWSHLNWSIDHQWWPSLAPLQRHLIHHQWRQWIANGEYSKSLWNFYMNLCCISKVKDQMNMITDQSCKTRTSNNSPIARHSYSYLDQECLAIGLLSKE